MPFVSQDYIDSLSSEDRMRLLNTHIPFGTHPETDDRLLIPQADRYAGTYIIGTQGNGKSGLLENLIAHDAAANNAIIVVDPHGDLLSNCLAVLPASRLAHTYLLDLEDETYPFGANLFAAGKVDTDVARTQAIEKILHVFEVLWPEVMSQQNLPRYLRAAAVTFLANPGSTLVDMYRFLMDASVRHTMLKNVTDSTVLQFWQAQYDDLSLAEQTRRVQPLINRLESLFLGRTLVRNVVGQRVNSISFRKAIENREIILMRLPVKTMPQDAKLIGTLMLAQIHGAIFSFGDMPADKRPSVSLYVDEVQNFATSDFAELFTEGRKFSVKTNIAHQYRNQLPSFLQDSTMTARTIVSFHLTPEDARELAHVFPAQEADLLPEDIEAHPVAHLLSYGSDDLIIKRFIDFYLRPLQQYKRGNRVEIDHYSYDFINNKPLPQPRIADPTPYLDNLLYEVMRTHNPYLPIPPYAVIGFANCGINFYKHVIGIPANDPVLLARVQYPHALVVPTADGGLRWTRTPESSSEQLYHFMFHLRQTMFALAQAPIGKRSAPSTSAVAQMLAALPKRAAFVRSGESVGVIYTDNTPAGVSEGELAVRIERIREQTRSKYCHPKAEVEQAFMQPQGDVPELGKSTTTPSSEPLLLSRWEEL